MRKGGLFCASFADALSSGSRTAAAERCAWCGESRPHRSRSWTAWATGACCTTEARTPAARVDPAKGGPRVFFPRALLARVQEKDKTRSSRLGVYKSAECCVRAVFWEFFQEEFSFFRRSRPRRAVARAFARVRNSEASLGEPIRAKAFSPVFFPEQSEQQSPRNLNLPRARLSRARARKASSCHRVQAGAQAWLRARKRGFVGNVQRQDRFSQFSLVFESGLSRVVSRGFCDDRECVWRATLGAVLGVRWDSLPKSERGCWKRPRYEFRERFAHPYSRLGRRSVARRHLSSVSTDLNRSSIRREVL